MDYFNPSMQLNPYLHTWYLSLIIQFLVLIPVAAMLLRRSSGKLKWVLWCVGSLSSLIIFYQESLPDSITSLLPFFLRAGEGGDVYYMTAGRFWQVAAGAFIMQLPDVSNKLTRTSLTALSLASLIMIAYWPTEGLCANAWLAVLACMVFVRYGEDTYFNKIFSAAPLLWLGSISFSLYLWHWPVFVFGKYLLIFPPAWQESLALIFIALLISFITHLFIERNRIRLGVTLFCAACGMTLTVILFLTDGLKGYIHPALDKVTSPSMGISSEKFNLPKNTEWIKSFPPNMSRIFTANHQHAGCLQLGDPEKEPTFILMGDSIAAAIASGMNTSAKKRGWSGIYITGYITPFWNRLNVENKQLTWRFTEEQAKALIDWIGKNESIKTVIIAQLWQYRFDKTARTWDGSPIPYEGSIEFTNKSLQTFLVKLRSKGVDVVCIAPLPKLELRGSESLIDYSNRMVIRRLYLGLQEKPACVQLSEYEYDNKEAIQALTESAELGLIHILGSKGFFFQTGSYTPQRHTILEYADETHLSKEGADLLIESLAGKLSQYISN